jgi:DedD protein
MANVSAAAENADQLRRRANRRLLGASVLLLIAIILVPIFLEREPPPLPDNVEVKIPPVEGTKFDPKLPDRKAAPTEVPSITEPTGAQASAGNAIGNSGNVAQPQLPSPPVTGQEAVKAKESIVAKDSAIAAKKEAIPPKAEPAKPNATPAAAPAAPAASNPEKPATRSGQLVVAGFSGFDKAKALKMPAYTEQITVSNGTVTRVRVGPYDGKPAAEKARAKLAQAGLEAKVITLP